MSDPFTRGTLGHAALTYIKAAWPVFPLKPATKEPFEQTHGFKDATTNPETVVRWWLRNPDANIGTPTGLLYDVLDIDCRLLGDGFDAADRLSAAGLLRGAVARSRTRNGGEQWFHPAGDQQTRTFKKHFIDIKANGGYVVVPPSKVPADEGVDGPGRYTWLEFDVRSPGEPLDGARIKAFLDPPRRTDNTDRTPRSGSVDVVRLAEWLAGQGEGNRNNALFWAANKGLAGGLDPDELADQARSLGLSEREIKATIASARRSCS